MSAHLMQETLSGTQRTPPMRAAVRLWLLFVAVLIAAMVMVGGATRLTDSGLSITEWQPIVGTLPPLGEAAWRAAFELYKQIPEYQIINPNMSLEEFKFIFWWEWAHRFLGRFVGLAFFVPFVFFWLRGALSGLAFKLLVVFLLGGAQGALGWYMVQSGLADRVDVSQYRLAAHLGLAVALFGYVMWLIFDLGAPGATQQKAWSTRSRFATLLALLVFAQILLGAFVAGMDAGLGYNTWPLMDEQWVPDGLLDLTPVWINLFENTIMVQFAHRMLAYVIVLAALYQAWRLWRADIPVRERTLGFAFLGAVLVQAGLGIATLLAFVPLSLALLHQLAALVVFGLALSQLHTMLRTSP